MTNIVTISGYERSGTSTAALLAVASLIAREHRAGGRPTVLVVSRTQHWADVHRRTLEAECLERRLVSAVGDAGGDYRTYVMGAHNSCHLSLASLDFAILDGMCESEARTFLLRKDLPNIQRAFIATSKPVKLSPITDSVDIPPPAVWAHPQGMPHESA